MRGSPRIAALQTQLQGGLVPSWQTTVVPDCAGTTTVVFAGSGGLLLLIQPVNRPTIPKETISAFIPVASRKTMTGTKYRQLGFAPLSLDRGSYHQRGPTEC